MSLNQRAVSFSRVWLKQCKEQGTISEERGVASESSHHVGSAPPDLSAFPAMDEADAHSEAVPRKRVAGKKGGNAFVVDPNGHGSIPYPSEHANPH